jgi:uncharacterized iron-regulated membrane protein
VARTTNMRLRALWLQIHKWIGLILAILIIPLSLSGSALVWHDALDETINPQRYQAEGAATLAPSAYAAAARTALGQGERIATIRYPEHGAGPLVVSATRPSAGRPQRSSVWLDPGSGRVLDRASADAGLVRIVHNLHGSLLVPGWGRTIVGWIGVAMFGSCLTGIWLWWPIGGGLRRGFRWKRQNSTNANLHHQLGIWILLPLAMLSFTGAWIVFAPSGPRPQPAQPLAETRLTPDAALAAAQPLARGARLTAITWPTDRSADWKLGFERVGEIGVNDASGAASAAPRAGGPQRSLMRRWHDGTGMGPVWQAIIFIGGIIPALLAVTGIVMWLRSRGWRAKLAAKRGARPAAAPPAE